MTYYKTDSRKISFSEYWNLASGFGWIVGWIYKILGQPLRLSYGIPEHQPFRELIVDHTMVPPEIMKKVSTAMVELQRCGFTQFWFTSLKNSLLGDAAYAMHGIHPSGQVTTKVIYVRMRTAERLVVAFLTELESGTILTTTNKKKDFRPLPEYRIQRNLGAGAAELWQLHQAALTKVSTLDKPRPVVNFDQLAAFEEKTTTRVYQDKIARGLWVPMTPAEVEAVKRKRASAPIGHA